MNNQVPNPRDPETSGAPPSQEHYQEAPGSGVAAILLFSQIALIGYLGYASYFLLSNWGSELPGAPAMSWQFYFPAVLAVTTFLPTDPLTRLVARVALAMGLLALAIAFLVSLASATGWILLVKAVVLVFLAAGPAVLLSRVVLAGLPKLTGGRRWGSIGTSLLAIVAMLWLLALARPAFENRFLYFTLAGAGGVLVGFHLVTLLIKPKFPESPHE